MDARAPGIYDFGPCRLEPANHLLTVSGNTRTLPPKAFETLVLLVENAGRLLRKDEMMQALWPGVFVEENNLTQQISLLRKLLGDGEGGSPYIETIPRIGYRFVGEVREFSPGAGKAFGIAEHARERVVIREVEEEEIETTEDPVKPMATLRAAAGRWARVLPRTSYGRLLAVSVAVAVALAAMVVPRIRRAAANPPAVTTWSLAVMPLRNLQPDPASDYLSIALAEAIAARLSRYQQVAVRPLSYSLAVEQAGASPQELAQRLGVRTLLFGNYVRAGEQLRIRMELVEVERQTAIWRDTVEVNERNLISVQDTVAMRVADALHLELTRAEAERARLDTPHDPRAYDYYLRGIDAGLRGGPHAALEMMRKSFALDPNYAPAWGQLASEYIYYGSFQGGGEEYIEKGMELYRKAMAMNPGDPWVPVELGVHLVEMGKLDEGTELLRGAARREPGLGEAHLWLGQAYRYGGMLEESLREAQQALALDATMREGSTQNTYLYLGRYEEFLESLPRGKSLEARTTFYRGLGLLYLGQKEKAVEEFDRAYGIEPALVHAQLGQAFKYAITGERELGRAVMQKMDMTHQPDGEMLYKAGQAYAMLGDHPRALRLLRQAVEKEFVCYPYYASDPLLDGLRKEREFAPILESAKQGSEAYRRKFF